MCKEMPVIPVNRVVDSKQIIGKMEGRGGGKVQRVAGPQNIAHSVKFVLKTSPSN
jgi:hypothetical protein